MTFSRRVLGSIARHSPLIRSVLITWGICAVGWTFFGWKLSAPIIAFLGPIYIAIGYAAARSEPCSGGHVATFVLNGARDGENVSFADSSIRWRCGRCGLERKPTEDEREEAMRDLIFHQTGFVVR